MRRAVIDIGTNSVKLLVADLDRAHSRITPVLERGIQTRLGRGFYTHRLLQTEPVAATAQTCRDFFRLAREHHAEEVILVATSAVREALNPELLLEAVLQATGRPVQILSGEEEADLAFLGVGTSPAILPDRRLILDVGGGSTEFILGIPESIPYRQSFPLGTVRTMESAVVSDPPAHGELHACQEQLHHFLQKQVAPSLRPQLDSISGPCPWIATGGTAALLACLELSLESFDRDRIEQCVLTRSALRSRCASLWQLSLAERRLLPGLPPNRADVILFGAAIMLAVLDAFEVTELRPSTRGLRFGALLR